MLYCRSREDQRCRISHGKLPTTVHHQPLKSNSNDDDDDDVCDEDHTPLTNIANQIDDDNGFLESCDEQ